MKPLIPHTNSKILLEITPSTHSGTSNNSQFLSAYFVYSSLGNFKNSQNPRSLLLAVQKAIQEGTVTLLSQKMPLFV